MVTARLAALDHTHRAAVDEVVQALGSAAEGPGPLRPPPVPPPDSEDEYLGAFDADGRLIGYACYGPAWGTDRGYDLYWIAVHPAAQHGGCGATLLAEVERRMRSLNARMAIAEVSSRADHAPIRAFYAARGFAESARIRGYYTPSYDRIVFTKRFQPLPRKTGDRPPSIVGWAGTPGDGDE